MKSKKYQRKKEKAKERKRLTVLLRTIKDQTKQKIQNGP